MALPPQFDQPAGHSLRRVDGAIDRGQAHLFRLLWFRVPPSSVAWNVQFQSLLASRFLSDLALQALLYGALIASARAAGTAWDAALIGVAFLLPGVLLGLHGGAVADVLPKRVALGGAYLVMGVLCFLIPIALGTGFIAMLLVLFTVRVLHQVSQPSEASAVPLVATREELASANSFLSLSSSAGEAAGKALLAPLIVRAFGVNPVTVLAGLLFLLSATRVFNFAVPPREGRNDQPREEREPPKSLRHRPPVREALHWLAEEPAAFWMLMLAAMASTINVVLGVLGPQYVSEVLNVDPGFTFYVFAPAAIGLVLGLIGAPAAIRLLGERRAATLGFVIVAAAMTAIGQIDAVTSAFGWVLVLDIPGVGERIEMAGAISTFIGFGMTLAAAAAQTYVGRYVPTTIHGRVFALLGTMKDGFAIPPLVVLGAIAAAIGVQTVLTLAPVALLVIAFAMSRLAAHWRPPDQEAGRILGPS